MVVMGRCQLGSVGELAADVEAAVEKPVEKGAFRNLETLVVTYVDTGVVRPKLVFRLCALICGNVC